MGRVGVCALVGAALCACGSRSTSLDGGTVGGGNVVDGTGTGSSFMLALTPGALSIAAGSSGTVQVVVTRQRGFAGTVELSLDPPSLGTFSTPSMPDGTNLSVLRLDAPLGAPEGTTRATITARSGAFFITATLELTVTAPAALGLVDGDGTENSPADQLFPALLREVGVRFTQARADDLRRFDTIVWYTGPRALTQAEQATLRAFLDEGGRRVVLFSRTSLEDLGSSAPARHSESRLNARGVSVMTGLTLSVGPGGTALVPVTPKPGTETLFSAMVDAMPAAIAVGRKSLGALSSSSAVFFGFALEDVIDVGTDAKATALARMLNY